MPQNGCSRRKCVWFQAVYSAIFHFINFFEWVYVKYIKESGRKRKGLYEYVTRNESSILMRFASPSWTQTLVKWNQGEKAQLSIGRQVALYGVYHRRQRRWIDQQRPSTQQ